jgi:hypothetical protein
MGNFQNVRVHGREGDQLNAHEARACGVQRYGHRAPLAIGLLWAMCSTPAWAADDSAWHVALTPYVWAAGVYGDVTAKGLTAPVSASFIDVVENTDSIIGLQGRLEVSRGRWGGFVDGTYLKLGVDDIGPTRIDMITKLALVDFGIRYRAIDTTAAPDPFQPVPGTAPPGVVLDLYGGGRFWWLDVELEPEAVGSVGQSRSWADPIVGVRLIANLTEKLFLVVGGDVGGFGVSSDFTWSTLGLIGYRFSMFGADASVVAGYRALGDDYSSGEGRRSFRWDTVMHGPVLGLNVRF